MTQTSLPSSWLASRALPAAAPNNLALIDAFLERLWAESGVSRHTLAAYRRDLEGLARCPGLRGAPLDRLDRQALFGYLAQRTAAGYSARSNARLLSALRAFYAQLMQIGMASGRERQWQ